MIGLSSRREFLKKLFAVGAISFSGCLNLIRTSYEAKKTFEGGKSMGSVKSKVYVIKTDDRVEGIRKLLEFFDLNTLNGKKVALKANYNSADPYPATTHPDTLGSIVDVLNEHNARVVVAERSGMGETRDVLETLGVYKLAEEKDFEVVVLDELDKDGWIQKEARTWKRGYLFAKVFEDANAVIQTCCLKTHRFGGHFTMSLKNSVGMIAKRAPGGIYNYMYELHAPLLGQREKIAEINTAYTPRVVIMDGIQGFSHGGPDKGTLIEPGIILASSDRVAIDATGVAVLRINTTTKDVSTGSVFQQAQLARALELGLGAGSSEEVQIIPVNTEAEDICSKIEMELAA